MINKYVKMILIFSGMLLASQISHADVWGDLTDWADKDSWKKWGAAKIRVLAEYLDEKNDKVEEGIADDSDLQDEVIDLSAKKVLKEEKAKVDFYDTLPIKYCPEQLLLGSEATLKKHLNRFFDAKKNQQAVAYFVSVERKNHDMAISLLESMTHEQRLTILLESPPAFIAKILMDMRKDFKGKTFMHWGPYELQSVYSGTKTVNDAEIKGESVSLRYMTFLLTFNTKSKEEFYKRSSYLAEILSHASGLDLESLLVYSLEEVVVKMGSKHESCFGAVKSKGYCDEETAIYLPHDFVGGLLNFMHNKSMISKQDLVSVLEAEFKVNRNRFEMILKRIDVGVLQEVILNFSDEIVASLPDEVILAVMPKQEYKENLPMLAMLEDGNSKKIINEIITEINDIEKLIEMIEGKEEL